jgi:hypothetical protein
MDNDNFTACQVFYALYLVRIDVENPRVIKKLPRFKAAGCTRDAQSSGLGKPRPPPSLPWRFSF